MLRGEVQPRRDDALAGVEHDAHRLRGDVAEPVEVAQQVADHALHAGAQRIRLDVVHQPDQAPAQPGDHAARQARIARQLAVDRRLGNVQQQRIGQALGVDRVGAVEKHRRFAERLPRPEDLDHLLGALRRQEAELHLAVHDRVKPDAGVAALEHHAPLRQAQFGGSGGDPVELIAAQFMEQRQVRQEGPRHHFRSAHGNQALFVVGGSARRHCGPDFDRRGRR